ncbi:MAG: ogr/Delta-like zinc finger family protein [Pseudomonas sp.]|uniref:ogr/Delta-like zinc finger family protein n=1 Tax=Pseudomonas sp. TaxID=306 RepID=UPI0033994569
MGFLNRNKRSQFHCPFCAAPLIRRTSWLVHPFMRQENYQCDFTGCGASFQGASELTHISSPSGMPDPPRCSLPETPTFLRVMAQRVYQRNLATRQMELLDLHDEPELTQ